ncbi:hypothetical protein LXA43DRAFT_1067642 [Ganoderma leucocontextum]|nr:hypothetical protein LXA43DRAFT_1067642 [Ganoderma leucocontextum]
MQTDLSKRLPVEILAMIFHAWKNSCGPRRHGLRAEWVRATWICKRWRKVALETPALWSSILVSRKLADSPVLKIHLDRAWSVTLDLLVSSCCMSRGQVENTFSLILARKKLIKRMTIVFNGQHGAIIKTFVMKVASEVMSLSLDPNTSLVDWRWKFTQDNFPHLSRLVLHGIIPIPGTPLLNLTELYLDHVVEDSPKKAEKPWMFVHRFLAACPNLETLHSVYSFEYPLEYLDPHNDYRDLPVVELPKLRYLSADGIALDTSTALGTLRLPALSTFDITARSGIDPGDCDFFVIPQNVSEALPPIRRSRCLSLMAGGRTNDLTLQGSPGDTFEAESDWSVTLPDLEPTDADSDFLQYPCCLRYNCSRFLVRLPHLAVPSTLVRLELHVANGLSVVLDWAWFFAAMARLQALRVGNDVLITHVLEVFEADPRLCPELEDLELCIGTGPNSAEEPALAEFTTHAPIGAWVRARETVEDIDGSDAVDSDLDSEPSSDSGSGSGSDLNMVQPGLGDGSGSAARDTKSASLKLWHDLAATLKPEGSVGEVFLATTHCSACNMEYGPMDSVEFGNGGTAAPNMKQAGYCGQVCTGSPSHYHGRRLLSYMMNTLLSSHHHNLDFYEHGVDGTHEHDAIQQPLVTFTTIFRSLFSMSGSNVCETVISPMEFAMYYSSMSAESRVKDGSFASSCSQHQLK